MVRTSSRTPSAVSPNTGRSSDPRKEAVSHSRRDRSQSRKDRSVSLTRDSSHDRHGRSSSIQSRSSSIQSRSSSTQARTRSSSIQVKTRSSSRQGRTRATSQPRQDPARKTVTSPSRNFAMWHAQHSIRVEHVGHISPSKRDSQLESRSKDVSKYSRKSYKRRPRNCFPAIRYTTEISSHWTCCETLLLLQHQ
jgi:hypothetical protein